MSPNVLKKIFWDYKRSFMGIIDNKNRTASDLADEHQDDNSTSSYLRFHDHHPVPPDQQRLLRRVR